MKHLILTLALLASPAFAGGPIITEEEPPIADVRPHGDGGKWVVPVIVGALVLGAILIGSDNCNSGEPTDGCR